VAEALDITDLLDRQAGKLSGGQKRRLHTGIALLHRPALLLLDEATTGADVETRGHILGLVRNLAAEGSSVLYSTHYLAEVENLGASAAIIDAGRVIARDDVDVLIARHASPVVEIAFADDVPTLEGTDGAVIEGSRLRVSTPDPAATIAAIVPQVPSGQLVSIEIVKPSLESVYLTLTGRRYDEADAAGARASEDGSRVPG
jgi:ABC-2 type transport system ATP-binding protein